MNWFLDVFAHDQSYCTSVFSPAEEAEYERALRAGVCEDDYESTCPHVCMLPEESGKEQGSPLNFRG